MGRMKIVHYKNELALKALWLDFLFKGKSEIARRKEREGMWLRALTYLASLEVAAKKPQHFSGRARGTERLKRQSNFWLPMNDLPVIGFHAMFKEVWDRQGANIASR